MTSTSTLRDWWSDYLCDTSQYDRVHFPGPDGPHQWNLYVARAAVPAFEVFADIMGRHGYMFRESSGGTYNCRTIGDSDNMSLHAYAVCIDLNPSKNPYGTDRTDMPADMCDEIGDLKTGNGSRVFTWGMSWSPTSSKDPMHWQIDCSPSDVASGIIYDGGIPEMSEGPNGEPNWDEVSDWARKAWTAAHAAGVITDDSHPRDDLEVEQLMVYLDRAKVI